MSFERPSTHQKYVLLRIKNVVAITGLPVSSIYAEMAAATFPRPIQLSAKRVAWIESDVQTWIRDRIEANQKQEPLHRVVRRATRGVER